MDAEPQTSAENDAEPSAPDQPSTEVDAEPEGDGPERERDDQGRLLGREAATYRRRLRETESERDQLREQLDALQRVEVERLASANGLAVPGDIWQFGATLDTLRSEDGSVDRGVVEGLVNDMLRDRPGLKAQPVGSLGIGRGGNAIRRTEVGLSDLLKPGTR